MAEWNQIEIVQKMQDYIENHINENDQDIDSLYRYVGYSKRHADRLFKELLGKTPYEYARLLRLSKSSRELLEAEKTILEVALDHNYDSHEGYTKAFFNAFKANPSDYRKGETPIPLFIGYSIRDYYSHYQKRSGTYMETKSRLCIVIPVCRPKRLIMLKRSEKATDYWSYCEEKGCEWEGLFNSIPGGFDTAAILELPESMLKNGYSNIASGVELPENYNGAVPEDCELVPLEPCDMLYFQSEPYENPETFAEVIETVIKAQYSFDYAAYGYEKAPELAPSFNFGSSPEKGARFAVPVKKIK